MALHSVQHMNLRMQALHAKALLINVGDIVVLDTPSPEFPGSANAGLHTITSRGGTFLKVADNTRPVPVERVTGIVRHFAGQVS